MSWLLASRRRVVVATVAALVALDAGRSIYARIGYAEARERWRPAPADYASIRWPPGVDLQADAPLGARVYAQHCAVCHGPNGRGNGPAAPSLRPRPRDFTSGEFKYKSTPPEAPAADADLIRTVREGLRASAMPYFGDLLSDEEVRAVVAHLKTFSKSEGSPGEPLHVPPRAPPDAVSLARGKELFLLSCTPCHGNDYRGGEREVGAPPARDLTAPWTFRGGSEPEQVWLRLTAGMVSSPMPSWQVALSDEQRWDLVNFVESVARVPPWAPGGQLDGPGRDSDPVRRGKYLVQLEMCGLCHTQIDPAGIYREDGFFLAGGMRVRAWPHANFVSRNLTSDKETGIGDFTTEQIATVIRTGRRPDRVLDPWGMPWFVLHSFAPEDALAIAAHLGTLPPVQNRVPEPLHFGFIETLVGKLSTPLPAAMPYFLEYADGNWGESGPSMGIARDLPQRVLEIAQIVVLVLGAAIFTFAGPREKRFPRGARDWAKALGILLGLLILAFIARVIVALPQIIPAEQLSQAVMSGLPTADPKQFGTPEQLALVQRGQYLFKVTSCAFCHGFDGSGGAKISWKPFGTLFARNITSDRETGIGRWSNQQIARAIRSGVSRDGRQLHWQGMTWDLLSNLDEEDLRALIAYLRTLPAVRKVIHPPRPPAPDDCDLYRFFLRGRLDEPGCR